VDVIILNFSPLKRAWGIYMKNFFRKFALYRRFELVEVLLKRQKESEDHLSEMQEQLSGIQDRVSVTEDLIKGTAEQLNITTEDYDRRVYVTEENTRSNNERLAELEMTGNDKEKRVFMVEENMRNMNAGMEKIRSNQAMLSAKQDVLRKQISQIGLGGVLTSVEIKEPAAVSSETVSQNAYEGIDYFDFENHFRGSEQVIKDRQMEYLPYYQGRTNVVDLGCGRGEFLDLLQEQGVKARGVDLYDEFVHLCRGKGLDVYNKDAIQFLEEIDGTDGIFAGQLVEHLSIEQIVHLCNTAYDKLETGGYFIMETPNPMSLAIYTHSFYMDPSHQKPVHPLTLQYITQKAGFSEVNILFTEGSRLPGGIPELKGESIENINEFNESMKLVSDFIFGSQDYAVIAKR